MSTRAVAAELGVDNSSLARGRVLTARLAEDDAVTVGWSFSDAMAAWDPVM
ncbi:MAG: hypothetical protein U0990_05470 [Candidatus Nanopelagicales bacterium]|nr:hypothetical protein [Candidatus Nanopelagicales bacterium]MDZ4249522.1 hypothetical protein [Candidatus Nanopelagicales bacterium]